MSLVLPSLFLWVFPLFLNCNQAVFNDVSLLTVYRHMRKKPPQLNFMVALAGPRHLFYRVDGQKIEFRVG